MPGDDCQEEIEGKYDQRTTLSLMLGVLKGNNNIYVCVFLETHLVELKCVERKGHFAEELPTTKGPWAMHTAQHIDKTFLLAKLLKATR